MLSGSLAGKGRTGRRNDTRMTGVLHAVAAPHGTGLSRVSKPRGRGSKGTAGHAGARGKAGLGRAAGARRRAGAQGAVSRSQPAAVKRRGRHQGAPVSLPFVTSWLDSACTAHRRCLSGCPGCSGHCVQTPSENFLSLGDCPRAEWHVAMR